MIGVTRVLSPDETSDRADVVDHLRPGVRGQHLQPARVPLAQLHLQRVVGRVEFVPAGSVDSREVRVGTEQLTERDHPTPKTQIAWDDAEEGVFHLIVQPVA